MTSSLHSGGPLVVVDDVHLTLGSPAGPVNILRGISLEIAAGETVALVGPSGSGKSTLLMVLGGLERPSAGRVLVDGHDLGALSEDALARLRRSHDRHRVPGFSSDPDDDRARKRGVAAGARRSQGRICRGRAGSEAVGLGHRLGHYPAQLSGGEQQRVAIARAFIAGPKLLLADEPTGNLDAVTGGLVIDCLFDQHAQHGTTLLLITHDESLAERCARRIRLADGTITEDGSTAQPQFGAARRAL